MRLSFSGKSSMMALLLALVATVLLCHRLADLLPPGEWLRTALHPDAASPAQLTLHFSLLPRIGVAVLAGAALALAGVLFQQVLRNPLAEPATMGISAGGGLAITLGTAVLPAMATAWGRPVLALAGGLAAAALAFGLSSRQKFAPLAVLLAGLLMSLYCGALTVGLQLLADPYDFSFFLWGSGSLVQQDGRLFFWLLECLPVPALCAIPLIRPLTVMALQEEGARGLGLSLAPARLAALGVATALAACVTSAVGIIGFVGLAAPALARACGARRVGAQLFWSAILGGLILWLTDEVVLTLFGMGREWLPTGAATALVGAPLLLLLAPRVSDDAFPRTLGSVVGHIRRPVRRIAIGLAALALCAYAALHLGQLTQGWAWSGALLPFRWPHLLGATAAGMLLAMSGVLLQRLTGNPMASPDLLGISEGAACGRIVATALAGSAVGGAAWVGSAAGAALVLAIVLIFGGSDARRAQPDKLLLVGLAMNAMSGVAIAVALLGTGPAMGSLRAWLLGDTGLITARLAVAVMLLLPVAAMALWLLRRWLALLPLGGASSSSLGLSVPAARGLLLLLAGVMTATAIVLVGPLGFVGLMSGHLARMQGFHRPLPQLTAAALAGGSIMLLADWAGHNMAAPYMLPAGLIATLIGGPYLMLLLLRKGAYSGL